MMQASGEPCHNIGNLRAIWSRLPLFWRFQLAGWAAFVPLTFPLKVMLAGTIPGALLLSVIRDGSSFALTLGMWVIYRRVLNEQNRYRVIVPIVTVVCLTAGLLQTGFVLLFHDIFPLEKEVFFITSVEFSLFYERTAILVCWSLLYVGIKQMRDGMERELRLSLVESEKRGAELKLLRAQMNPHFLFNSLTAIEAGLGKQLPNVSGMVQALADYLHYSLTHRNDDLVPMGEEYDALMGYLALERARLDGKLNIDCQIDDEARKALVPGIILQPLVENAVKYGRETSPSPLQLRLHVLRSGPELQIEVSNSGRWIETDKNRTSGGVGLENLQRRLALLYPGQHRMEITREAETCFGPNLHPCQMMSEETLRALIVDDEAPAREHLTQLLECHCNVKIVGEANSVATAAALSRDLQPNLIFLDVQMPGADGFSLLSKLDPLPAIIFVTGYDEYAVRAFEVNAVDYLIKPVNPQRLADALQRIIHAPPQTERKPFLPDDRIFLRNGKRARVVYVSQISGIKAEENYTDVLVADGSTVFMRRAISEWDELLPKPPFFTPHRSLIVNLQAVGDLVLESRAEIHFKLEGHPYPFRLGQRPAARLRRALRLSCGL